MNVDAVRTKIKCDLRQTIYNIKKTEWTYWCVNYVIGVNVCGANLLFIYSSIDGFTRRTCDAIQGLRRSVGDGCGFRFGFSFTGPCLFFRLSRIRLWFGQLLQNLLGLWLDLVAVAVFCSGHCLLF